MNPSQMLGQIKNKFDFHLKLVHSEILTKPDTLYIEPIYSATLPTILGNLNPMFGFEIGLLASNRSFFIQPGITYSFQKQSGNQNIQNLFENLQLTSHAVGLQCKFNLFKYGKKFINPYIQVNTNFIYSSIRSDQSSYEAQIQSSSPDVSYFIDFNTEAFHKSFLSTSFGLSIGTELLITSNVFIIYEIGVSTRSFPDFDIKSPFLFTTLRNSIGIRYKLFRDKKYLYK